MPGASHDRTVQSPLAQRSATVRADIVRRTKLPGHIVKSQFALTHRHGLAFARLQVTDFGYFDQITHLFVFSSQNFYSCCMNPGRFQDAITHIDAANAQDPRGVELPYAQRLSAWVERLEPKASEELRLAARAQHICRWMTPRESYPSGRIGYLKWREDLKQFHARKAGEILRQLSYEETTVAHVQDLIRKRNFPRNAESCVLEDALCLMFLETQFAETTAKTGDEKMLGILQKTWRKMTPQAREIALTLPMSTGQRALVEKALAGFTS